MIAAQTGSGVRQRRIAIIGAGPVGLLLACLLADSGQEVLVLEERAGTEKSSRSIGIHPPALEALALVGAAEPLIASGVIISRALVYLEKRPLGELSLDACPPPYPFVLSVPQDITETVLEERLNFIAPRALQRERPVTALRLADDGIRLVLGDGSTIDADFVVGCDGRRSAVRASFGVGFRGSSHSDHYLMADLADDSSFGSAAILFLGRSGVVESFPLPGGKRRWVARTTERVGQPEIAELAQLVRERTGCELGAAGTAVANAFTAETRLATTMAGERWALAGDAAHVVSPIGGQGMNLGWLGARSLAAMLTDRHPGWRPQRYQRIQRRRARRTARRARFNMLLGSERFSPLAREAALRAMLAAPLKRLSPRYFTMRGL